MLRVQFNNLKLHFYTEESQISLLYIVPGFASSTTGKNVSGITVRVPEEDVTWDGHNC